MNNPPKKILLVSFPWASPAPYIFISQAIQILSAFSDDIILLNGNTNRIKTNSEKIHIIDIGISMHYSGNEKFRIISMVNWVFICITAQIKTGYYVYKLRNEFDIVLFYMAYPYYLLSLIISTILKKKTVEIITRTPPSDITKKIIAIIDPIYYQLLTGISPETPGLINSLNLLKYKHKLLCEGARFVNVSNFKVIVKNSERKKVVGFIGRLTKEKGILEFIAAIPLISQYDNQLEFFIGGDGPLSKTTKSYCNDLEARLGIKITMSGWISNDDMPQYLNKIKILVIPSYDDAFPTIALESMACGTILLSKSSAGINDVITDNFTGFLMEDNLPTTIAANVIRILNRQNLDNITENANTLIQRKYTLKAAINRWKLIINPNY